MDISTNSPRFGLYSGMNECRGGRYVRWIFRHEIKKFGNDMVYKIAGTDRLIKELVA